jgi:endonuclease/exonuclease/phosphatase (EEP) superfamily protein YafD
VPAVRPLTRALLHALAAVVAATTVLVAAPAAQASPTDPTQLRVGTFNVISRASTDTFATAVSQVKPQVDVLGLQEVGMNSKNWWLRSDDAWGYYRPPALQQNPVIWDESQFDFVSGTGVLLSDATSVEGTTGYGEEAKTANWATVVRLRHLASGQVVSFVNVHLVAYAIRGGRFIAERPRAAALYRTQLRALVAAVAAESLTSSAVYVLGDFNAGYREDVRTHRRNLPVRQLGAIGFHSMWEQSPLLRRRLGTHDNGSLIDQVWSPSAPVSTQIMSWVQGSDHRPAVATYAVAPGF